MHSTSGSRWFHLLVLAAACLLPRPAAAHPGSGIVVDRVGQVYFVDMVSGVWKLDARGALTHLPGPAFHWMALDAGDRFRASKLPSGSSWELARIGTHPTLLLASDFPIAMGRDGNLYHPTQGGGAPLKVLKLLPSGKTSIHATLPAQGAHGPLLYLNGLAAGPDGSLYYTEDDAIRRVSREGRISTVAEKIALVDCKSIPGKSAQNRPLLRGLDVDAGGNVYVAATGCGNVLKLTPDGKVSTLPQVPNPWAPTGVALFGKDLYVLEFQHPDSDDRSGMVPRVRKIAADGKTVVLATVTRR
jgi:streptogramin lyase